MKMELTKDELNMLNYSLSGTLKKLVADKRLVNEQFGEDFDGTFESLIQKCIALEGRIYDALTTLEDQER